MHRIGVLDFDTSHVAAFVTRLNRVGIGEEHWVEGATIVVGCPGSSDIYPERIPVETAKVRELGLELVDSPLDMLRYDLDAVFIESNSGLVHLERARPFLERKIPVFVDKPFACHLKDARAMVDLADQAGVPLMSASSLRYAPEVAAFRDSPDAGQANLSATTYGPGHLDDKNPGLCHYGIHAVEMLFTLLGPGCVEVVASTGGHQDLVTGRWKDGRLGTVVATRPSSDYAMTTVVEGKVRSTSLNTKFIYRDLLKAIVTMLDTGKSPIPAAEMLEIVAFMEQARISQANHGLPQAVQI